MAKYLSAVAGIYQDIRRRFANKMKNLFYYNAYGLNITSELFLPDLVTNHSNSDVFIHEKKNGAPPGCNNNRKWSLKISEDKNASLYIKDQATFNVHAGKEITVETAKNADDVLIRQYIMGIIFGILHYRSLLPGVNRLWLVILSRYLLVPTTEVKFYVEVANG